MAGKLRAQRAKAMKFRDGYMIKSGRVREGEYVLLSSSYHISDVVYCINRGSTLVVGRGFLIPRFLALSVY